MFASRTRVTTWLPILTTISLLILSQMTSITEARRRRSRYSNPNEPVCNLKVACKSPSGATLPASSNVPVSLPIRGPRGHKGESGAKGERGSSGMDGIPGMPGFSGRPEKQKIAFFAALSRNMNPTHDGEKAIVFDNIITNAGRGYDTTSGKFVAPCKGMYQFNIIISPIGQKQAAVELMKNTASILKVWAESIPLWASSSATAILDLDLGDEVYLVVSGSGGNLLPYLHGYKYSTFSGFMIFDM